MNLLGWIRQLLDCELEPERLDFEGLEEALLELRGRLDSDLEEMADLLAGVCDDLDRFLDSEDFDHLRAAAEKAQELVDMQAQLRYEAELESRTGGILVTDEG
jgi:hypothetical protein